MFAVDGVGVGGDTKIGSGANFVDVRRGSIDSMEEVDGAVNGASTFVDGARSPVTHLCTFAQHECFDMG